MAGNILKRAIDWYARFGEDAVDRNRWRDAMRKFSSCCDDHYINMHLNTEMELPQGRETVLHFFEQMRRRFPLMENFYSRERSDFILEEDKERGSYRWVTVESRRICAGMVNPSEPAEALELHEFVLEQVPYVLSISPLDCESLNVMYGFDFTYRGNHNQVLAEAIGIAPALESIGELPGARLVNYEPSVQLALDSDCRTQCRLGVETRTSAYHVRTGEFPEDQLSVYLTARRFGSLGPDESYKSAAQSLAAVCEELLDHHVVDQVLVPLQQTIAMK